MSDGFEPLDADLSEMARLHDVLSAARAPGRPDELAGEDAAVAAFRSATARSAPRAHGRRARRLFAIKVGALAGALAIGATAVAATTGVIPLRPPSSTGGTNVSPIPDAAPGHGKSSAHPSTEATRPQLIGQCRAYLEHMRVHPAPKPDKSWDPESFRALSAAAGGDERVQPYCTDLVAADDKGRGRTSTPAVKR